MHVALGLEQFEERGEVRSFDRQAEHAAERRGIGAGNRAKRRTRVDVTDVTANLADAAVEDRATAHLTEGGIGAERRPVNTGLVGVLKLDFKHLGFENHLPVDTVVGHTQILFDQAQLVRHGAHDHNTGLRVDHRLAAVGGADDGLKGRFQILQKSAFESVSTRTDEEDCAAPAPAGLRHRCRRYLNRHR